MKPNLGKPMRVSYVVMGAALLAVPLAGGLDLWMRVAAPIVGLLAIVTGATGW